MDFDIDIDWIKLTELNTRLTEQVKELNGYVSSLNKIGTAIGDAWKGSDSAAFKTSYASYLKSVKNIVGFLEEVNTKIIPETIEKHSTTVEDNTVKVDAAINS